MERFQGRNDIPVNGWELIRRDLGYDEAGNPTSTVNPHVILYNKYQGILRVFVAVGRQFGGYQHAEIRLIFSTAGTHKSAALNRQSALGVALEDTEPGTATEFSSIARYLNDGSKWFVGDFPIDYDPCTCQFDSRLRLEVNLISEMKVDLTGDTNGTIVTTANGSTTGGFSDGIPFIQKTNKPLKAAGTGYDNIDKLSSKIIKSGGNSAAAASLASAAKSGSFLKDGLKNLPWVGAAMGVLDFFVGGGQDSAPQPLALQPLSISMTTKTTGTITTNNLYATVPFNNPGNRLATAIPENTPYYNEALGVFSLLKRPVVDVIEDEVVTGTTRDNMIFTSTQTYRLTQDLEYVINPASKMEVVDFEVALVAHGSSSTLTGQPGGRFTIAEGYSIQDDGSRRTMYRTPYFDAACIKNQRPAWVSTVRGGQQRTTTPAQQVFIKVMLNLRPIGASATQQNVLLVARYPVTINGVPSHTPLPAAACGVLPQASNSAIQAVCGSSRYVTAVTLIKKNDGGSASLSAGQGAANQAATGVSTLVAYPNPAQDVVRFAYSLAQPGPVHLLIRDALGREALRVAERGAAQAGPAEVSASVAALQPGIYYCTLETASGRVVQKLVVTR